MKKYLCLLIVLVCSLFVFNLVMADEIYSLNFIDNMELKSISVDNVNKMSDRKLERIAQRVINYAAPNMYPDSKYNLYESDVERYQDVTNKDSFIEIYKNINTVLFNKGYDYIKKESTSVLPSEKKAVVIAEQHLEKLDLLPDSSELVLLNVGGVNMDVYDARTGETASYKKLITVRYGRKISGLSVVGPGSRIIVKLGSNGQLNGLVYNWTSYTTEDISTVKGVRSTDSLAQEIEKRLRTAAKNGASNSVKKELVMYDDGKGHIEPVIYVKADMEYGTGTRTVRSQYDFYVPLLKSPKAEYPNISNAPVPPSKDNIN